MANMTFSESLKEVHADIGALLRELASAQEQVSELVRQASDAERNLLDKEAKERKERQEREREERFRSMLESQDDLAVHVGGEDETPAEETPAAPSEPEETPAPEAPVDTPKPVGTTIVIVSDGGKVNIRVGNGTNYTRITAAAPGTTFEYVATAANGWNAVIVGAKVGWVSGKYSRII